MRILTSIVYFITSCIRLLGFILCHITTFGEVTLDEVGLRMVFGPHKLEIRYLQKLSERLVEEHERAFKDGRRELAQSCSNKLVIVHEHINMLIACDQHSVAFPTANGYNGLPCTAPFVLETVVPVQKTRVRSPFRV